MLLQQRRKGTWLTLLWACCGSNRLRESRPVLLRGLNEAMVPHKEVRPSPGLVSARSCGGHSGWLHGWPGQAIKPPSFRPADWLARPSSLAFQPCNPSTACSASVQCAATQLAAHVSTRGGSSWLCLVPSASTSLPACHRCRGCAGHAQRLAVSGSFPWQYPQLCPPPLLWLCRANAASSRRSCWTASWRSCFGRSWAQSVSTHPR